MLDTNSKGRAVAALRERATLAQPAGVCDAVCRPMRTLLFSLVIGFAGCSKSDAPAPAPLTAPDPAGARASIEKGAAVLDVREPDEFADGHLPTAVNVPVGEIATRLGEVDALVGRDRARPIVVYCASGGRAAKAKRALEEAGFTHVINGGGLRDLR